MQQEVEKTFHLSIETVTVAALMLLSGILLLFGRMAFSNFYSNKAVTEEAGKKATFNKYSGELSPDMTINFIVTYGEQFRYIYKSGSRCFVSMNMTERLREAAKTNEKFSGCIWDDSKQLPLISVDLIDWFRNSFRTLRPDGSYGLRFLLKPMTAEGVFIDIKDCKEASIILVEEVL